MFDSASTFRKSLICISVLAASLSASAANEAGITQDRAERATSVAAMALRAGDRVNLSVFERAGREEDKWPNAGQRLPDLSRNFFQRPELSGEYVVQDDGTIALPFLKQVHAAGIPASDFETAVASRFEEVFHRGAFVSVIAVEHKPIFIVGPVKNPGTYKYTFGMTVLHAIALAGGTDRTVETWHALEAAREETRLEQSSVVASRLLARQAVLRAERDGTAFAVPSRLIQLVGSAEASALVDDEAALRRLVLSARRAKEATLRSTVESAKGELEFAKDRISPIEANINLRADRLKAITSLAGHGIASKSQLVEVQNSLSDVEGRKQELMSATAAAKHKLELAEEELTRFGIEYQTQLHLDISAVEREIADNLSTISHGQKVLRAFNADLGVRSNSAKQNFVYEILRRTEAGTQTIRAEAISELEPGDLVQLKIGDEAAAVSAELESCRGGMQSSPRCKIWNAGQ